MHPNVKHMIYEQTLVSRSSIRYKEIYKILHFPNTVVLNKLYILLER